MNTLPDYINSDVKVLFVGINPGLRSAIVGHHFAGYSNRFWKLLRESELVPEPLTSQDDWRLPLWGIGLTNIVSRPTSGSKELTRDDYQKGRVGLESKIRKYGIGLIAPLGVTIWPILHPSIGDRNLRTPGSSSQSPLGFQPQTFAGARVFLLPNPSGRNAYYSYADMLHQYKILSRALRQGKEEGVRQKDKRFRRRR